MEHHLPGIIQLLVPLLIRKVLLKGLLMMDKTNS
jgi:hypothetical protein